MDEASSPPLPAPRTAAGLAPCPHRPNCACTQDGDRRHGVLPFTYACAQPEAFAGLVAVVKAMPRSAIITADGSYLHATFTSRFLHFIDDLECLLDDASKRIQVRSAARQGYYDFGVNRARIESLRMRIAGAVP